SSNTKSKHLSIHARKTAIRPRSLLSPPPQELINSGARTGTSLERKLSVEVSNQGNTVHAKLVISGPCVRNQSYVINALVNSMGPYIFPCDSTVAANHTHQLYTLLLPS